MYQVDKIINISDEHDALMSKAIVLFGLKSQIGLAIEECGEFLTALNQHDRGRVSSDAVCEEIADVIIVMGQMAKIFNENAVMRHIERKLDRLSVSITNHRKRF